MTSISKIKEHILTTGGLKLNTIAWLYTIFGGNKISIAKGNNIKFNGQFLRKTTILVTGKRNRIVFEQDGMNHLSNATIVINGNDNVIHFGRGNSLYNTEIIIDDDNGAVRFGNDNKFCGKTHIAEIEGTSVSFGDGCLFSSNVTFRTGDSHSILDLETHNRINPSKSIIIGNRVWFGNSTTILKGVTILDDTIVGTGALVTKSPDCGNCVLAGNPATILKNNVYWNTNRNI